MVCGIVLGIRVMPIDQFFNFLSAVFLKLPKCGMKS